MTTEIQLLRGGSWESIIYSDFSIEVPTSEIGTAPSASVTAQAREDVSANQDLRIVIDGTTRFEGVTESSGTVRSRGQLELNAVHGAESLFAESVDVELTGTVTATDVLQAGLSNANRGSNFTLSWSGSDLTLESDYSVDNRKLSQLFQDMCDRSGRLFWVDPSGSTIHVEPRGGRGTWNSLDATQDGIGIQSWDEGSVKTVRNDVVVNATAEENVTGSDLDATSIETYGRRSEEINISYAATAAEADAYASELLIPEPLSQGEIDVPQSAGNIVQPLVNFTVDLVDSAKGIDTTDQVVEKQTIQQGRVRLKIGEGSAVSMANVRRNAKSNGDENPPGSIMPEERIGNDAISTQKLVDTAVVQSKLDDLSVSETKIQDGSISTPKLETEAVVATKIETGSITALQIDSDTITANEIDVLDLDTAQLSIGGPDSYFEFSEQTGATGEQFLVMEPGGTEGYCIIGTGSNPVGITADSVAAADFDPLNGDNTGTVGELNNAFQDVVAYNFIDASDGSTLSDGGDPLDGLAGMDTLPDFTRGTDGKGTNVSILSQWLFDVCSAQQEAMEEQEERIESLEERLSALEEQL